jgi:hypothetical protein
MLLLELAGDRVFKEAIQAIKPKLRYWLENLEPRDRKNLGDPNEELCYWINEMLGWDEQTSAAEGGGTEAHWFSRRVRFSLHGHLTLRAGRRYPSSRDQQTRSWLVFPVRTAGYFLGTIDAPCAGAEGTALAKKIAMIRSMTTALVEPEYNSIFIEGMHAIRVEKSIEQYYKEQMHSFKTSCFNLKRRITDICEKTLELILPTAIKPGTVVDILRAIADSVTSSRKIDALGPYISATNTIYNDINAITWQSGKDGLPLKDLRTQMADLYSELIWSYTIFNPKSDSVPDDNTIPREFSQLAGMALGKLSDISLRCCKYDALFMGQRLFDAANYPEEQAKRKAFYPLIALTATLNELALNYMKYGDWARSAIIRVHCNDAELCLIWTNHIALNVDVELRLKSLGAFSTKHGLKALKIALDKYSPPGEIEWSNPTDDIFKVEVRVPITFYGKDSNK